MRLLASKIGVVLLATAGMGVWTPNVLAPGAAAAPRHVPAPVVRHVPTSAHLAWPSMGEAAVAVPAMGVSWLHGSEVSVPIASVTKMMTAYLVLKTLPLAPGQDGPTFLMTAQDAAAYRSDLMHGDSVLKVSAGERLTERQMLEGLLLPSGDNIADILATRLGGGSEAAFVARMNDAATQLGMTHTHYADASGLNPHSVSTASDQVKLAEAVMQNPTFRDIVGMHGAWLPVAGRVRNTDRLLGLDGVQGIKTGSTSAAGGCLVSAFTVTVAGKPVTAYSAVLGIKRRPILLLAIGASQRLIVSVDAAIKAVAN